MNDHQRVYLMFGPEMPLGFTGDAFVSEEEAQTCWSKNKTKLTLKCQPGQRPYGFYRFDLGIASPDHWFDAVTLLLERDLINPVEALGIERLCTIMDPDQPPELYSHFGKETGSPNALSAAMPERVYHLDRYAREFEAAATFHRWRKRELLEKKYFDLALECRATIAGITTDWLDDLNFDES